MGILPDVALLRIFDFYLDKARNGEWYLSKAWADAWHTLVHVCRNWRNVAFGSPRHLNLRLHCTASTPVREKLSVWPPLPIVVENDSNGHKVWGVDDIVAALEHSDRIYAIHLRVPGPILKEVVATMQQPCPELTRLDLWPGGKNPPFIPASFLGGSAPRLQHVRLCHVRFPGLPNLLLSATHLVGLTLWDIPHRGHISPEAMATCLSGLTRLESLVFTLKSRRSRPGRETRRPPPRTRALLPALTAWEFKGVDEYLEDLVARIDAPLLASLYISFFHQLTFDNSQLAQFICRTPKFNAHHEAHVVFSDWDVSVTLPQTLGGSIGVEIEAPY